MLQFPCFRFRTLVSTLQRFPFALKIYVRMQVTQILITISSFDVTDVIREKPSDINIVNSMLQLLPDIPDSQLCQSVCVDTL